MIARTWPTSASSSSGMRISSRVPATGEGTSVSTLSVETSTRGSSTSTCSPTSFSQRVTVPSVTDSPRAGSRTSVPEAEPAAGAAGAAAGAAGASATGAGAAGAAAAAGAAGAAAPEPSPMIARAAPTSTSSSSGTRICSTTPATGEGTSVSTLSVETSTRGASTSMVSPTSTSQRVTVPSVTDSPSAGSTTVWDIIFPVLLVNA